MQGASLGRRFVITLTLALALGVGTLAEETEQPKKRKPALNTGEAAQTQTAPAEGKSPADTKGKPVDKEKAKKQPPKDPTQAGWMTVKGRIVTVTPERRAVIIRTDTTDYQVYVTDKTQLTRDGQAVDIKALQVNDRVESCHFNAKRAVQTLKVISVEKNLVPRPNPERQEPPPKP